MRLLTNIDDWGHSAAMVSGLCTICLYIQPLVNLSLLKQISIRSSLHAATIIIYHQAFYTEYFSANMLLLV